MKISQVGGATCEKKMPRKALFYKGKCNHFELVLAFY